MLCPHEIDMYICAYVSFGIFTSSINCIILKTKSVQLMNLFLQNKSKENYYTTRDMSKLYLPSSL